jgi:hypothetical protein
MTQYFLRYSQTQRTRIRIIKAEIEKKRAVNIRESIK